MSTPPTSQSPPERPWVLINMSMTADGKIASPNRRLNSFGSPIDLDHLYSLRATADAVLCGATTAVESNARLDCLPKYRRRRIRAGLPEQPLRVVVSGTASLPSNAAVLRRDPSSVVVLVTESAPKYQVIRLRSTGAQIVAFGRTTVDFATALPWLRSQHRIHRLLGEGGATLNASLLTAGLVDELHLTICPLLLGGRDAPSIADQPLTGLLQHAVGAELASCRRRGNELFAVYHFPARPSLNPAQPQHPSPFIPPVSTPPAAPSATINPIGD